MRSHDLQDNGVLDWDDTGLLAAFAALKQVQQKTRRRRAETNVWYLPLLCRIRPRHTHPVFHSLHALLCVCVSYFAQSASSGVDVEQNSTAQASAVFSYASAAVEPFNTTVMQAGTFNTSGLAAARVEAEVRYASNLAADSPGFTAADEAAVEMAYRNASLDNSGAAAAASAVLDAVQTAFQNGEQALPAVVEAVSADQEAPALLFPDAVTLNGTVRPLARGWGIDRFPCSRTTGLDIFREGDFDLPLRMKQLERMSQYMYHFYTQPYFADAVADADCLETEVIAPLRNGECMFVCVCLVHICV